MDNFGIKVAALLANVLMIVAFSVLAAVAFGSISEAGWMAGFVILGASAIGQVHTLFSVSNLFSERPTLIMGIINGCADGSALLFLVFRSIYESGVSLGAIFVGYIVGPLLITTCLALFLWPWWPLVPVLGNAAAVAQSSAAESTDVKPKVDPVTPLGEQEGAPETNATGDPAGAQTPMPCTSDAADQEHASSKNTVDEQSALVSAGGGSSENSVVDSDSAAAATRPAEQAAGHGTADEPDEADAAVAPEAAVDGAEDEDAGAAAPSKQLVPEDRAHPYMGLPLKEQALSPVFLGLAAFSLVSLFKFSFYLAAFDAQANFLGQEGGTYTTVLGIVMSCAIAVVPVIGLGIDRYGLHNAVVANFAFSLAVSIVTLIPNLEIQAFGTVLFLVFRGFVFTVLSGCLAAEFGFANFGALIGSVSFIAGLLGLLISPLFDLSLNTFDGDFTVANAIVAVFTVVVQGPFTVYYWRYRMGVDSLGAEDDAASVRSGDSSSAAAPVVGTAVVEPEHRSISEGSEGARPPAKAAPQDDSIAAV